MTNEKRKHSKFEQEVWEMLKKIPSGKVASYLDIAKAMGRPLASRAVGNAIGKNSFAPEIPCHRVVCSSGKIGGYAKGASEKIQLLEKEGIKVKKGRIADFESKRHFLK